MAQQHTGNFSFLLESSPFSKTLLDFMACDQIDLPTRVNIVLDTASTLINFAEKHLANPLHISLDLNGDNTEKAERDAAAAFQRNCNAVNAANDAHLEKNYKLLQDVLRLTGENETSEADDTATDPQTKKRAAKEPPPEQQPPKRRDSRMVWQSLHKNDTTLSWD